MAEIRRIVPSPSLSDFRRVSPDAGGTFRMLAEAADAAYGRLAPAAMAEMEASGKEAGREAARRMLGDPAGTTTRSAMGGSEFRSALRASESGGNASIVNSEGYGGLYQWGPNRLADWNRATGQNVTMAQFLGDASIQERAQDWHENDILGQLGGYVGRTVNGQVLDEAALIGMAHLGGVGGARRYIETGGAYDPADSNGTKLSDYARRFGGLSVTTSTQGVTMVQTPAGNVEPRLYSPLSGEILQAHNAAAQIAFGSEVMLRSQADMTTMAGEFLLNPEGFKQAAEGYIEEMVANAPEMWRGDLRADLTETAQRVYLGIVEDQQRDTRQRAANASGALVERYSTEYADALATGDAREIAATGARLNSVLTARESLPGVAWTPEQSENVRIGARKKADEVAAKRRKEVENGWKTALDTIIKAAREGLSGADESLLEDPSVASAIPDLWREAVAAVTFRDALPSFNSSPKAERDAAVADLRDNPVTAGYQVDIVKAAEAANKTVTDAFEADPIAAAATYLPQKPPEMPDFSNPETAVAGFAARAAYAHGLVASGHAPYLSFLSKEEADALGAALGKDVPAEIRLATASAVIEGFGADAARVFGEIKMDDPVLKMSALLVSRTDNSAIASLAMKG